MILDCFDFLLPIYNFNGSTPTDEPQLVALRDVQVEMEEDRISHLPKHLIDSILERLPVQDAVRTSILSKKWRYKWITMRALVFDEDFFNKFENNEAFGCNGFIRIINKVLFLHMGPILKLYLHLPLLYLDVFPEIDQWMLFLSRNGVKELALTDSKLARTDSNRHYELSSYVFSCLELTKLKLANCIFKPPHDFGGFLNLEYLSLKKIDFVANSCGTLISLPQLKMLSLEGCRNVYKFNIKATKLRSLNVFHCSDAMFFRLLDSLCLFFVCIIMGRPNKDSEQVVKMNLEHVASSLSNLPIIDSFAFDGFFLQILGVGKIPKRIPNTVNSLKSLSLSFFNPCNVHCLRGALRLLQSSPNLERLHLSLHNSGLKIYDVPYVTHLEAPDCLDQTLDQLQTVEITNLKGLKPQLLLIKLLLAHSPKLEKLTTEPCRTFDAYKMLIIAKDVLLFPRASPKAEMIYKIPSHNLDSMSKSNRIRNWAHSSDMFFKVKLYLPIRIDGFRLAMAQGLEILLTRFCSFCFAFASTRMCIFGCLCVMG